MGQAKARKAAALTGTPWATTPGDDLPKDLIARAVREPLLRDNALRFWETSGSCVHQAEIGRRILKERFGLDTTLFVGDFMRPVGGGLHHTYTQEDGRISVETGACHAWLFCPARGEYIDLAAWETPVRMERHGAPWTGPRPDYVWDRPERLSRQGFICKVDKAASAEVAMNLARGRDADFLALYLREALAVLDGDVVGAAPVL